MSPEEPGRGVPDRMLDDLDALLGAGLEAVEPGGLVREALAGDPWPGGRPLILAVGKAAPGMAGAAAAALDGDHGGVVLAPRGAPGDALRSPGARSLLRLEGGHPLPDAGGVEAARRIRDRIREASRDDEPILLLLSGGGSALLTLPSPGLSLDDVRETTRLLQGAGADIAGLNAVRKHLEELKGGGLARAAAPAPIRALILSDVVGDHLHVIASGPVSPDPTTFGDALDVLERSGVVADVPGPVREHLEAGAAGDREETPGPGDPCFRRVRTRIVGNVETAARAVAREARSRGYRTRILGIGMTGEARKVGRRLGRLARRIRRRTAPVAPPACVVAGGETTVTVRGGGKGGRNQEVALGAAAEIAGLAGVLVASLGTDGVDGPTDAAGGRVTGTTLERARRRGLDPEDALARNDAYPLLDALDDLIVTGPTGTNVMDVQVVLVRG